jgi:hypothetical protein
MGARTNFIWFGTSVQTMEHIFLPREIFRIREDFREHRKFRENFRENQNSRENYTFLAQTKYSGYFKKVSTKHQVSIFMYCSILLQNIKKHVIIYCIRHSSEK